MSNADELKQMFLGDRWKRILVYAVVLVAVFLFGLVPMWLMAHSRAVERDQSRLELRRCLIQTALASAAIDARMGNYEPARQSASDFFTELRAELDKGDGSIFDKSQHENLTTLLLSRDDLITLLARSDPAAAVRLSDIFVSYRKALGDAASER